MGRWREKETGTKCSFIIMVSIRNVLNANNEFSSPRNILRISFLTFLLIFGSRKYFSISQTFENESLNQIEILTGNWSCLIFTG